MFNDKINSSIAEAAKRCMDEELKGNQHKIDANKNGKIDAEDFKKLRKEETIDEAKYEPAEPDAEAIAKKKAREEAQRRREEKAERDADDLSKDYKPKTVAKTTQKVAGSAYGGAKQKDIEEEVEQIDELKKSTLGSYIKKATDDVSYHSFSAGSMDAKDPERPSVDAKAFKRQKGIEKATDKLTKEDCSFSNLIESYKEGGIKSLFESLQKEEATEDEFNAELKKQKDKAEGKAPQADVAAAATQGTKDMKEEVELTLEETQELVENGNEDLDRLISAHQKKLDKLQPGTPKHKEYTNHVNDLKLAKKSGWEAVWKKRGMSFGKANFQKLNKEEVEDLEERTLTSAETAEKERIVKGMKKGIEGFKQRYGERAKEVMYATATKQAKED